MSDFTALFMLIGFIFGAGTMLLGGWFGARLVLRLIRDRDPVVMDVISHAEIPDSSGEVKDN